MSVDGICKSMWFLCWGVVKHQLIHSKQGVSVDGICKSIRQLTVLKKMSNLNSLFIQCGIKEGNDDAVEVTFVSNVHFIALL